MKIISIKALEVLDSRGNPTVEAELILENSFSVRRTDSSGAAEKKKHWN